MRILLYHAYNEVEKNILSLLKEGVEKHGHQADIIFRLDYTEEKLDKYDLVFTSRVASSLHIMQACLKRHKHVIYFDKGYMNRGWSATKEKAQIRFSLNSFQPLHYFQKIKRPFDRWEKLNLKVQPHQKNGSKVIFAGCSPKFARWHGFDPTPYATQIIQAIRQLTDRPVIYRCKPSDRAATPIEGSVISRGERRIHEELVGAHALVTFSSNAALDAIIAGVPAFVLGPGIAKPVSLEDLTQINTPYFPSEAERQQWLNDVAYCQWNPKEIQSGEMWKHFEELIANEAPEWNQRLQELTEPAKIPQLQKS